MRLDPEKDKLDAKIQYLKEHLNSGKTANELEKEFEDYYANVLAVEEEKERIKALDRAIAGESVLEYGVTNKNYDTNNYCTYGNLRTSRVCTLQAITNVILMKSYLNKWHGIIELDGYSKVYCKFDTGRFEYSEEWSRFEKILIDNMQGRYYDSISGEHNFTFYSWK